MAIDITNVSNLASTNCLQNTQGSYNIYCILFFFFINGKEPRSFAKLTECKFFHVEVVRKLSYLIGLFISFFINLKIFHCLIRQFITPMFSLYSALSYWKTGNTLHNLLARCTAQLTNFTYWTCISVHVNTITIGSKYPKSNYLFSEVINPIYRSNTATVILLYSTQGQITQKTLSVLEWPKQKTFWWTVLAIFLLPSTLFSFCSPNTA